MHPGFLWTGVWIFALPMVVNILYVLLPPQGGTPVENGRYPLWEGVEQVTRILYLLALCLLVSDEAALISSPYLYISAGFLALYFLCWLRYFCGGRELSLLHRSFCFVPQPLAVFPVAYFFFAALWLHNPVAAGVMVLFAIAHNIVTYRNTHWEEGQGRLLGETKGGEEK